MKWDERSKECLERDNYTCRKCGIDANIYYNCIVSSHHIVPRKRSLDDSLNNLACLCPSCHKKTDNAYLRYGLTNLMRKWIKENENESRKNA